MPRTTLTPDPDVATELQRRRQLNGTSLKQEVNDLLRAGMRLQDLTPKRRRFKTAALPLGRPLLDSFDDVAEVLAIAEGEDHR